MSELSDLARETTICPFCQAAPGEQCRTSSGLRSQFLHSARERPVMRAWGMGVREGEDTILEMLTDPSRKEVLQRRLTAYVARTHRQSPDGCTCGYTWDSNASEFFALDRQLEFELHVEEVLG